MKYLFVSLFALAAAALSLHPAFAGDASEFKPLGFSADGRYYAFAQSGSFDGSGAAYADVAVVEVARNAFVAKKSFRFDDINEENLGTPEEALKKALAAVRLDRFGITAGQRLGQDLLVVLPTDLSERRNSRFTTEFWAEGGASATLPRYDVIVTERAARDDSEGKYCTELGYAPKIIDVRLQGVAGNSTEGFRAELQSDKALPKSRGCAIGYRVQRVTRLGDSLVVALSYSTPGFEGPDVRSMVVSGKVKFE